MPTRREMTGAEPTTAEGHDLQTLLRAALQRLDRLESARLDAEILLAHTLRRARSFLHAWPHSTATAQQARDYRGLVARRADGEPVAYLTGRWEFWSMELAITPDTLVPRPDTETLVRLALQRIPRLGAWNIADLGTGSGAIALALGRERPQSTIIATDRCGAALTVAQVNRNRHRLDNVRFLHGDWCRPLRQGSFDMIVANPPYVAEDDPHLLGIGTRFEPRGALAAGPLGLDDVRILVPQAVTALRPGGWLLLEHGNEQHPAVSRLLADYGYCDISDHRDWAGNPRVAIGRVPA